MSSLLIKRLWLTISPTLRTFFIVLLVSSFSSPYTVLAQSRAVQPGPPTGSPSSGAPVGSIQSEIKPVPFVTPASVPVYQNYIYQATVQKQAYEQVKLQDVQRVKSIQEQISQLQKIKEVAGSTTKPTSKQNKLVLLNSLLDQTKQHEIEVTAAESNLDKWIAYWRQHMQTDQWNADRSRDDVISAQQSRETANTAARLQQQTAAGTDKWKQLNYMPPLVGNDGWNSVPWRRN